MQAKRWVIVGTASAVAMLMGVTSALGAPVSVGRSGWSWGDPVPQGNTLNNVTFLGARGFAVGEFGTVLRSGDGGSSWTGLPSGTKSSLSLVQEVDSNTVIVGGGCTVRESVNGGESFQRVAIDASEVNCPEKVASFSFLSQGTGFVEQADGSILETTNGGQTLQPKTPVPLNGATASKIYFTSATTGFALTGGAGGRIFRTSDGANSWTQVASSPASLSDLTFVTPTTAFAVGAGNTLLLSTDAGVSWTARALALPAGTGQLALRDISCSDVTHCLIATAPAAGANTNQLVRTIDGGLTGSLVSPSGQNLLAVSFSTSSNVVAVGQNGATVLSSDGGATFPTLVSHSLGSLFSRSIRIGQSALDAYALGDAGAIAATTNGGEAWSLLRVPSSGQLTDVGFPTTDIGYVVNSAGTVLRTADAGLSWSILNAAGGAATALLAPSVNTVLLSGPRGVRRSTDAGGHFAPVNATVVVSRAHAGPRRVKLSSFDLSGGAQIAGGAIFAYGEDVLESTDGGSHWVLIPRPLPRHPVSAISFVSPTSGYETSDGRTFFTSSRGRSWREILSVGAASLDAPGQMSFSTALKGYLHVPYGAAGAANVLLRTENGGRSWTPESLPAALNVVAAAGLVDYAAGENGTADALLQTTDGGLSASPSALTLAITGARRLSARKLRKGGDRVHLAGHLGPASGGETVTVSHRTIGGAWRSRDVTVSSSGTFALTVSGVSQTTDFVAQWIGEGTESGAGTPAVRFTVTRP